MEIWNFAESPISSIRGDTVSMNTVGPVRSSYVTIKVISLVFVIVIVNATFDSVTLLEICACRSSVLSSSDSLVMVAFKI